MSIPTPPPGQPSTTQAPTEAQPPALAIRGLVKIFGNLVAVANLNLDIPKGSFYGFVGPNGAGKTTTLNMATGLLTPDQGTAYVNGIDVWKDDRAARAQLGVMPDGMRLLDRLSGADFLVHVGMLRGLDRETARQRAHQLLDTLDLTDAGKKLISDYSAGMTKKISLAAALIHAHSLLVLDEPFEAVDPVSAANIRQILQDFTSRGGTVILSSHVMATVQQLCTHVAVINHGQVLASGTTEEVAAGMSLDERFAQLVGGVHTSEGLSWLAN
ncbi:MAG: ABC transporter ATP-binding protein [Actinomyces sp.]|nr:ABC transporter ATP-binding protein [Actinomyces sp.]